MKCKAERRRTSCHYNVNTVHLHREIDGRDSELRLIERETAIEKASNFHQISTINSLERRFQNLSLKKRRSTVSYLPHGGELRRAIHQRILILKLPRLFFNFYR